MSPGGNIAVTGAKQTDRQTDRHKRMEREFIILVENYLTDESTNRELGTATVYYTLILVTPFVTTPMSKNK
jgi:hypothetical protein